MCIYTCMQTTCWDYILGYAFGECLLYFDLQKFLYYYFILFSVLSCRLWNDMFENILVPDCFLESNFWFCLSQILLSIWPNSKWQCQTCVSGSSLPLKYTGKGWSNSEYIYTWCWEDQMRNPSPTPNSFLTEKSLAVYLPTANLVTKGRKMAFKCAFRRGKYRWGK